jgi:hypothetical protein
MEFVKKLRRFQLVAMAASGKMTAMTANILLVKENIFKTAGGAVNCYRSVFMNAVATTHTARWQGSHKTAGLPMPMQARALAFALPLPGCVVVASDALRRELVVGVSSTVRSIRLLG